MASNSNQDSPKDKTPSRAQEIQLNMRALAGRDAQLLGLLLLMVLVLSAGMLTLVYPNLVSSAGTLHIDIKFLPQLFFGLISLVVLFNVYIVVQKRDLYTARRRLVEELIFNERMDTVSLVDSVTQLYNRRAMEHMLSHEVARTKRLDTPLSLMIMEISNFENISNRLGSAETERFLYEAAQLVKSTLRGSDMIFRHKASQFLAVMPDTTEQQVDYAIQRLVAEIERHNVEYRSQAELAFSFGVAQYAQGSRITDALLTAERKAFLHKHDFKTVF